MRQMHINTHINRPTTAVKHTEETRGNIKTIKTQKAIQLNTSTLFI